MAESDPREFRGGVREPDTEGQGDEGLVPREMVEDDPAGDKSAEDNELVDAVQGQVTDKDPQDSAIDTSGGDEADATQGLSGRTADSPDELTDDNTKGKWDVANAALGDTGDAKS